MTVDKFYSSTGMVTFVKTSEVTVIVKLFFFLQCKTTDYKSHV